MNKFKKIIGMLAVASVVACTKEEVSIPDFDVSVNGTEYTTQDSVTFNFQGDADIVTFYSGERGKMYEFKNRIEAVGKLELNMETQVLFGSQANNLSVLVSTDFNNTYDSTNVKAATWTDITSRFTLSSAAAGASGARVVSSKVDVSDLAVQGKPMYFAYRYIGQPISPASQRTWRIYAFNLTNTLPDNTVLSAATISTAGWLNVDFAHPTRWTIQATAPVLFYAPVSGTITRSEDWAISKALYPTTVNPDLGTAIKTFLDKPMRSFKYKFPSPGQYDVTFVANNANNQGQETKVKTIRLTIK
ncbi:DUF5017 domain-containing protein [Desertivirga brevis]|uniref:DUF5017 domain-containing protein n=1 Tax=Desertivirga brevis TaxID=2810310 RepID=UPI001A978FF8|nr:DUF5017 domain-containing protein [Pedobacter sp. SYSU D00873]